MPKIIIVIVSFFFICSCKERDNKGIAPILIKSNTYEDSTLSVAMQKFGLHNDNHGYMPDSNSLLFYCLRSFDSSFLIHFRQEQGKITGTYHLEMPTYYDVSDFAARENYLSFFEGYNFELDSARWQKVETKALILLNDTTFRASPGCRDCREYGLSYNRIIKVDNGVKYDPYYKFLQELFLSDFIRKRKPEAGVSK